MDGGCHCGAVRYRINTGSMVHALCHCSDCRRCAGAPMVGWLLIAEEGLTVIKGETRIYHSSQDGRRFFCEACGSGLFYRNAAILPGRVDIQSATLDDPNFVPAQAHIQVAERISWMKDAHHLPEFERYPQGD